MSPASGRMDGKTALVTGGTGGIGEATATALATLGAHVVVTGRDRGRGEAAVAEIRSESGNPAVELLLGDLSSQAEVRRLAGEFLGSHGRLHALVNNAGAMSAERRETVDGVELNLAVNHLAPFLLTRLLLPALEAASNEASSPSRVVNVTSGAHRFARGVGLDDLQAKRRYGAMNAYARAKLAGIMTTYELSRRTVLEGARITANVADPGGADTPMSRSIAREAKGLPLWVRLTGPLVDLAKTTTERAAYSSVYLASSPGVEGVSGRYYDRKGRPAASSKASYDAAAAKRLWEISEGLAGLPGWGSPNDAPRIEKEMSR